MNYKDILRKASSQSQNGNINMALRYYTEALRISGENTGEVLFEIASFLFKNQFYEEALENFILSYSNGYRREIVESIIMEAYYTPNISEFEKTYIKNIELLKDYEYISNGIEFKEFSKLRYKFIPYNKYKYAIFDSENKEFESVIELKEENTQVSYDEIIIIKNEYNIVKLNQIEKDNRNNELTLNMKNPMYLYYDCINEFSEYLQICNYINIIKSNRVVFLFGIDGLDKFFNNIQYNLPKKSIGILGYEDDVYKAISDKMYKRELEFKNNIEENSKYYEKKTKLDLIKKLKSRKLKILFMTSRFTTVLQYCIRDCIMSCESMNVGTEIIIENDDISILTSYEIVDKINKFKPDIFFIIDHFRFEHEPLIPDNLLFITWIQDPLPNIISTETPKKLKELDYILNLFTTYTEFKKLGYPDKKLIDGPFPVNEDVYKKYKISEDELKSLGADICYASNACNPYIALENFLKSISEDSVEYEVRQCFNEVFQECYEDIYRNLDSMFCDDDYRRLISKHLDKYRLNTKCEEQLQTVVYNFRINVGASIHRSVPLEWLAERGYSMKLWGNGFDTHPILSKYSMGIAQNGEMLSKVYQASKICLGLNQHITTHERVFHTLLSHSFYLARNIPKEHDWSDIRDFFEEGKDIVFFYNKEDLYKKIDFYLEKEDERRKIIYNGKKKTLQSYTYKATFDRLINELAERLEKEI